LKSRSCFLFEHDLGANAFVPRVNRYTRFRIMLWEVAPPLTSVVNLVATGIGVSIVPKSMAQVTTDGVVYCPLTNAPKVAITLVRRDEPEPRSAVMFAELVRARASGR
jgi:DNA-binding transcriptional LysR family regulator